YVRAFRALPRFRGEASLSSWLYRIVYNSCLDELRRAHRATEITLAELEGAADVADLGETVSTRRLVAGALMALPLEQRAALLLAVGLPHGAKPARAAEIKASVRRAVAQATSLEGRIVYRALNPQTRRVETTRFAFAADAEGDFRLRQLGGPSDLAYEAATGTEAAINTSASIGTGRFFSLRRGLPPGPPDQGPSDFLLGRALGATVRALLAARDPHIRAVTSDGRPAWQLDFALRPNRIFPD